MFLLRNFTRFYASSSSSLSTPATTTSILKKYEQFQQEFPGHVVLMQVGDFYEIYGAAAEPAAKILDIALTRTPNKLSSGGDTVSVPMTGFPVRSFETFLGKLIRAGVSIVVADQYVLPNSARFDRKISRVITPGTLVEENLLDRNRNNFLLLLDPNVMTCAWMDVSTGDFFTASCTNKTELLGLLARLKPREVILDERHLKENSKLLSFLKQSTIPVRELKEIKEDDSLFNDTDSSSESEVVLFTKNELKVAGKLCKYVKEVLRGSSIALKRLKRFAPAQHFMSIDADSFRSLDILSSSSGNPSSTLFNTLNECKTALGSRLLARRLQAPLLDPKSITEALDRVEAFTLLGSRSIEILQKKLDEVGDIERILQRLCLRRPQGVARDLKSLARSLLAASEAHKLQKSMSTANQTSTSTAAENLPSSDLLSQNLLDRLERIPSAIVDKPPLRDSEGEIFRPNFDSELDNLRQLRDNSTAVFSELAASYRQITGVPNLRIVLFKGDQYVVEVPKSIQLPEQVFRPIMQTETRARYTTEDLLTKSLLLRTISERVIERELALLSGLLEPVLELADEIRAIAEKVAHVDLESAFASLAIRRSYCKPRVEEGQFNLEIIDGRHPVLDKIFSQLPEDDMSDFNEEGDSDLPLPSLRQFTPNTLNLTHNNKFILLTGPNMGGKSTFLRQNALIVLMAQCGSFVPARHFSFSPIDAIFTRIGASDDLSRDKSTFMMEMSETAHILRCATARSLVLIDEIGRGTSATEGLALASAIAQHLIQKNRAWVLFATHYHEIIHSPLLIELNRYIQTAKTDAEILPDGSVLLLPKVSPGIATHSYALPVASLAGIPSQVISAAQSILNK